MPEPLSASRPDRRPPARAALTRQNRHVFGTRHVSATSPHPGSQLPESSAGSVTRTQSARLSASDHGNPALSDSQGSDAPRTQPQP